MKNRKCKRITCHIGVPLNFNVLTTVQAEKHHVTMELWPVGVHVKSNQEGKDELVVPYSNIQMIDLLPDESDHKNKK